MKTRFTNLLSLHRRETLFSKELQVLQEIEEIVSLIKNGQWHSLEDVTEKTELPEIKTNEILQFLANYNFIDLDRERKKVKVTPSLMEFLKENQTS